MMIIFAYLPYGLAEGISLSGKLQNKSPEVIDSVKTAFTSLKLSECSNFLVYFLPAIFHEGYKEREVDNLSFQLLCFSHLD